MTAGLHLFMLGIQRGPGFLRTRVTFRINFLRWPEDAAAPR